MKTSNLPKDPNKPNQVPLFSKTPCNLYKRWRSKFLLLTLKLIFSINICSKFNFNTISEILRELKLKFEQILKQKIRFKVRRRNLLRHPLFWISMFACETNLQHIHQSRPQILAKCNTISRMVIKMISFYISVLLRKINRIRLNISTRQL